MENNHTQNVETNQTVINSILKKLRSRKLEIGETVQVFEQILSLDDSGIDFPTDFHTLLTTNETHLVKYTAPKYVDERRAQQLCYCVLVKISQRCSQDFISRLFEKHKILENTSCSLASCLQFLQTSGVRDSDSFEFDVQSDTVAIIFRFLCQSYDKLEADIVKKDIRATIYQLAYCCFVMCLCEEDVILFGLKLLWRFMRDDLGLSFSFIKKGEYRIIFDIVSHNLFHECIVDAANSLITILFHQCHDLLNEIEHSVFEDEDEIEEDIKTKASVSYFKSEVIVFVFEKLAFYEEHPIFVLKFLDVVEFVASYKDHVNTLLDHDAVKILVGQMKRHCKDSMVQLKVINVVKKLPTEDDYDSRWLAEIFTAMLNHQDNAQVQEKACEALAERISSNPSITKLIGEEKNLLSLHVPVVAALNIHSSIDNYVFHAACGAVYQMAINSKVLSHLIYTKGASASIIRVMNANPSETIVHISGCRALRSLVSNHKYQAELLFYEEIQTLLHENLKRFTDPSVLKECIALLACLLRWLRIYFHQCMNPNVRIPELIVDIAIQNSDQQELVEIALEVIALFVYWEECPLLKQPSLISLRELLSVNKYNERIQVKGCIILQLVSEKFHVVSNISVCALVVEILIEVMGRFENSVDVQIEGCIAFYLLFSHKELGHYDMKLAAIEFNAQNTLFEILEYNNENDVVVLYSRMTLLNLASDQCLKDRMLQKACTGDFIKCAKFMIENGARIKDRPKRESPLSLAVDKNNLKLVELLLSHDFTGADEVLTQCLEDGKFEIAGIILRYIGFENDDITWSGLQIKELHPDLFYHILIDRTDPNHQMLTAIGQKRKPQPLGYSVQELTSQESSPSDSDCDESGKTLGRKIQVLSGPPLPYSKHDPRMKQLPSSDFIDDVYFPYMPEVMLSPGDLLHPPHIDGYRTPLLSEKTTTELRKSFSESIISQYNEESLDENPEQSKNDPESSPVQKMRSSRIVSRTSRRNNSLTTELLGIRELSEIKLLDFSHNQLNDLQEFLTCPSSLIITLLSGTETLLLNDNHFEEFSFSKALPNLKFLNLSNNKLKCFPKNLLLNSNLKMVDLSNNQISDVTGKMPVLWSLEKLDLSRNNLREFPVWVSESLPHIEKLLLSNNKIQEIPVQTGSLTNLKEMFLQHNEIKMVSENFFRCCVSLEKVNLSFNKLSKLPKYIPNTLCKLAQLKLSHNCLKEESPWFLPRLVLSVPSLALVDLSHNEITQLPDTQLWSSRVLRQLDLSHNKVQSFEITKQSKLFWPNIMTLNFSHNKIKEIPKNIGTLDTLGSLDFSHNKHITKIPDSFGFLSRLFHFPLDGLNLHHDPAILQHGARGIVQYFDSILRDSVPYHRMKLMLVGLEGRGKTSLMYRLSKNSPPRNLATNGIHINNWKLRPQRKKELPTFIVNTWDFAGQEDFYSTHQYFLTPRALYVAVYDASKGKTELDGLTVWLLNIRAAVPDAIVILVGTHSDRIPKEIRRSHLDELSRYINEFIKKPGFPYIKAKKFFVNCTRETKAMKKLREQIYETISDFRYENQKVIEQFVPQCYIDLEDLLRKEAEQMSQEKLLPYKKWEQLVTLCEHNGISLKGEELLRALRFLKDTGSIMHFSDPSGNFHDLYFIDPQWLCEMMALVVTVREINPFVSPQGILTVENAQLLFPRDNYPKEFVNRYFRLLRKFEIVFPLSEDEYLITARLPEKPPQHITTLQNTMLTSSILRRYVLPYTPSGFWARCITRILLYVRHHSNDGEIYETDYWRDGIYVKWHEQRYFLVSALHDTSAKDTFDIFVPNKNAGFKLLGGLVDLLDNLLEEWYPGLTEEGFSNLGSSILRLSPCDNCWVEGNDDPFYFSIEDCILASNQCNEIECEDCGMRKIRDIAPDIMFADIDGGLIQECVIQSDLSEDPLGIGAFGNVYIAKVENTTVAIKIFHDINGTSSSRALRQEVDILSRLHHPCLISMYGVCLRPRMVLLEYAPLGNLETILRERRGLSRGMQHRIALQIAEGLVFLHNLHIVYRDLKPGNVLVFSLSMGKIQNVKLSDYGISQWSSMMGLKSTRGTPGYQAPEILQKGTEYNIEIDIFAFGVTFYEIITGGMHPYGDITFSAQLDAAILSNRPMDNISLHKSPPWPDIETMIQQCLNGNPELRPTAREIRDDLLNVEVVCLKREIAVARGQSLECVTVRRCTNMETNRDDLEVWVGSGSCNAQSQLSWFILDTPKKQTVQGMIVTEGRILCMECFNDFIIIGTKSGAVVIFDGRNKEKIHTVQLVDSVLTMKVLATGKTAIGIADGTLLIFSTEKLINGDPEYKSISFNPDGESPVGCLTVFGNRLFCGYGRYVFELFPGDYTRSSVWSVGKKKHNNVHVIVHSKKYMFVACKDSHEVVIYDFENFHQNSCGSIDCHMFLKSEYGNVHTSRDCRVISMEMVERSTLWVGCASGHILVFDANNLSLSVTLNRHKSSVRSITAISRKNGKGSYVISTGQGFKRWYEAKDDVNVDGYVLIWDADLSKQKDQLMSEHTKRNEIAAEMAPMTS